MNTSSARSTEPAWFCLRARPMREVIAARLLQSRVCIEVFAPRLRLSRRRRSGGAHEIAEPLFPGYLFARFRYPDQVRHVLSTPGITGVVSMGQRPRVVEDVVIGSLRGYMIASEGEPVSPLLHPGDWVRIVHGAFRHAEGRVIALDHRAERVRLLLDVLGREVQVNVPVATIAPERRHVPRYPDAVLAAPRHLGAREAAWRLGRN